MRHSAFPGDEPLDERGAADTLALARRLPRTDQACCGSSLRTRQTVDALGLHASTDAALDECDFGRWTGRRIADIAHEEPAEAAAWAADLGAAPHGGESFVDLVERVRRWLENRADRGNRTLAVTHASVIRAAVVVTLHAPPEAFWRIDIAPLSQTVLHSRTGRWTLRSTGCA